METRYLAFDKRPFHNINIKHLDIIKFYYANIEEVWKNAEIDTYYGYYNLDIPFILDNSKDFKFSEPEKLTKMESAFLKGLCVTIIKHSKFKMLKPINCLKTDELAFSILLKIITNNDYNEITYTIVDKIYNKFINDNENKKTFEFMITHSTPVWFIHFHRTLNYLCTDEDIISTHYKRKKDLFKHCPEYQIHGLVYGYDE